MSKSPHGCDNDGIDIQKISKMGGRNIFQDRRSWNVHGDTNSK